MNVNKKFFLLEKPHLNHLLFLIALVVSVSKQIILIFINSKYKNDLSIPFFNLYIYVLGDFLSLIPYLIIKNKIKSQISREPKQKEKSNKSDGDLPYIYNNLSEIEFQKNKKNIILYIFFITIFDFISQISTIIFYIITGNQNTQVKQANLNFTLIFNVIFIFLFSRLFLHTTFYRHHFFSLVIFIICLIVIVVLDIIQIKKDSGNNFGKSFIFLAIKIINVTLYSFEDVTAKVMFLKYFFTPYVLLLMKAIFIFGYLVIFSFPFIFIKIKNGEVNEEKIIIFTTFKNIFEDKINYLLYFIYIIISFLYNILNYIIIDKFSANHSAISLIFENLGIFIINIIKKTIEINSHFAIRLVMYILLIFASFIYNEFLVINICGLANDTKLFLDYKEKEDLFLMNEMNKRIDSIDFLSEDNNNEISESKNKIELSNL